MNLNRLKFARAVAATASFTAAARECCVTQPTLSNGIAHLERELGERLFLRTTRHVTLTPFGVHLLPFIKEALKAHGHLTDQAQAFSNSDTRLIRIGTSPLVSANVFRSMVEPFRSQSPGIDIVLHEMNMADLHDMLDEGLLDVVFGVAKVYKERPSATFLYEEPLLYIPRGVKQPDDRPARSTVRFSDIAHETYVMVPDACGLARATRALFRSQRRKLHEYTGEAMSYQVLEEWAALGIGAAILPKSKVAGSAHCSLPITDKTGRTVTIGFEAAWSRTVRRPHLLEFADYMRSATSSVAV